MGSNSEYLRKRYPECFEEVLTSSDKLDDFLNECDDSVIVFMSWLSSILSSEYVDYGGISRRKARSMNVSLDAVRYGDAGVDYLCNGMVVVRASYWTEEYDEMRQSISGVIETCPLPIILMLKNKDEDLYPSVVDCL